MKIAAPKQSINQHINKSEEDLDIQKVNKNIKQRRTNIPSLHRQEKQVGEQDKAWIMYWECGYHLTTWIFLMLRGEEWNNKPKVR
jgi:hypothetical protein